ncbi:MAG: RNA ligase [Candidatus Helarchaeota archaeon]|nr:RNA ligase [Candidatus Helarchaeota archaeon]
MTILKHTSYEKMSESLNKWRLSKSDYSLFNKTKWVVTEKIHGANFCIHTDGKTIKFAKRKKILPEEEDFFGHISLKEYLGPKILKLFALIKEINEKIVQISVYGELFGGEYPHPEVPPNPNIQAIQTGIYYSPNIELCIFDIAFTDGSGNRDYLDFNLLENFCKQLSLFFTEPLFIGKFNEAINYKLGFKTSIPRKLGYPPLKNVENKAEGIVIKPYKSFFITTNKGELRPVLKKKIPEFSEDKRYQQARKWDYSQQYKKKQKIKVDEKFLENEVIPLITRQRLNNAISKVGKLTKKNKKKIRNELTEDVLETLNDNFNNFFENLKQDKKEMILEVISKQISKLIK